ncbi:glutamine amidotransferase [Halomonas maura]|uniref:glutamine amidotransferase n=1 Tax=Halomonas maura TaxID=117606 RepID=UPI0025B2DF29|nr:glutamine amidotransferase [Halomonas maura]MDN3556531.1 glutamine amidotransferase [Halomonas maura]
MPRLLIVKTGDTFEDVARVHGNFEELFLAVLRPLARRHPALSLSVFDARRDGDPPALDTLDAMVITGSHAMLSDAEPWSEALLPWLREAIAKDIAMLGVCYGHQLMATACGGTVGYHPAGRETGTQAITLTEAGHGDRLLGELPATFSAQLTHAQSILVTPPRAEVLAYNAHDAYQALRYGPRQWSVQFHPEFTAPVMRAYLSHQREDLAEQGQDADVLIEAVTPAPAASSVLRRFAERLVAGEL